MNSLTQGINGKLWSTYVIPRVLYGLEVLDLKQSEINQLERYQRQSLRQSQHLLESLALLGVLRIEMILHKNMLGLFWRWITSGGLESEIFFNSLRCRLLQKVPGTTRFATLNRYHLPPPSELIEIPPSKSKWKSAVDDAISRQVKKACREDMQGKITQKYTCILIDKVRLGQPHPVWATVRDSV